MKIQIKAITSHLLEWLSSRRLEIRVGEDVEKRKLCNCWWECKLVHLLGKIVWQVLKKLKLLQPYTPAIPLLRIYPKEMTTGY